MKKTIGLLGIIALAVIIGFSMAACGEVDPAGDPDGTGGNTSTTSLNGVWVAADNASVKVTVNGNSAVITSMSNVNALWTNAMSKGYVKVGDQYWRNLKSTGTLKWSGQQKNVSYRTSTPNVAEGTVWVDRILTLSADGQTLNSSDSNGGETLTWTRGPNTSLNGVWVADGDTNVKITVSGNSGKISSMSNVNALWTNAMSKGYVKVGDQYWRNLKSTGTSGLTWSGQQKNVSYKTSTPNVAEGTVWVDRIFTMSANGQTLSSSDSKGAETLHWTRQ